MFTTFAGCLGVVRTHVRTQPGTSLCIFRNTRQAFPCVNACLGFSLYAHGCTAVHSSYFLIIYDFFQPHFLGLFRSHSFGRVEGASFRITWLDEMQSLSNGFRGDAAVASNRGGESPREFTAVTWMSCHDEDVLSMIVRDAKVRSMGLRCVRML